MTLQTSVARAEPRTRRARLAGVVDRLRGWPLPWPHTLIAVWTGFMLIGGPRAAKLGPGPVYPNEVLFVVAAAGMLALPSIRRARFAALARLRIPWWWAAAVALLMVTTVFALIRGAHTYGRATIDDAGLGYVMVAPFAAFAFAGRRDWQDGFLRVYMWASIITFPLLVLSYEGLNAFAPLSLSIGFVLLFSLAPLLDGWLQHRVSWIARLYVVAAVAWVLWQVASRSALVSLVAGLATVVMAMVRTSRRSARLAVAAVAVLIVAAVAAIVAPATLRAIPPIRLAADTLNMPLNQKGNDARWRLDYAKELLRRSVSSAPNAIVGVGFGKPSRFIWREDSRTKLGYDYRGTPIPRGVVQNGDVTGPHNGFPDVVYRMGWPAGVALVVLLFFPLLEGIRAVRLARNDDARALRVLLATTVAGVVVLLTSDSLRVPEAAVPFWCVVGILAARAAAVRRAQA